MMDAKLKAYQTWPSDQGMMLNPSRLYPLEPVGVTTTDVESMTGYVVRLAHAHRIMPRTLILDEIVPHLAKSATYANRAGAYDQLTGQWWKNCSPALNSFTVSAQQWVSVFEQLTLRSDLSYLTMLPWVDQFSCRG